MENIEDSPLLTKINDKLVELEGDVSQIKISITPEAEYFEAEKAQSQVLSFAFQLVKPIEQKH